MFTKWNVCRALFWISFWLIGDPLVLRAQYPRSVSDQYSTRRTATMSSIRPAQAELEARPVLTRVVPAVSQETQDRPVDTELPQPEPASRDKPEAVKAKDSAQRKQLDVASLTGPMPAAHSLFGKMQLDSAFEKSLKARTNEQGVEPFGEDLVIASPGTLEEDFIPGYTFCWAAPNFYHQPLYFEQPYLERLGAGPHRALQPWSAGLAFYGRLPFVPFAMLKHPPRSRDYTLGHPRPGN